MDREVKNEVRGAAHASCSKEHVILRPAVAADGLVKPRNRQLERSMDNIDPSKGPPRIHGFHPRAEEPGRVGSASNTNETDPEPVRPASRFDVHRWPPNHGTPELVAPPWSAVTTPQALERV
jgi:hypothetical protein